MTCLPDRIRELRRVRAGELIPNRKNWRLHPPAQREAMRGMLAEVGYVDALIAREREDGRLELIDGHLRAELTPEDEVPVLVVDVSESEADKILATFDPLSTMAKADGDKLDRLLREINTGNGAVQSLLAEVAHSAGLYQSDDSEDGEVSIDEGCQLLVECHDEADQRQLYERLVSEGYGCRVLTL